MHAWPDSARSGYSKFVRAHAFAFGEQRPLYEQLMNNISPLPRSAKDARLSRPEAEAPEASEVQLQARRTKLRRIVAWVVGGATLLMCAGLVRIAIRSHSQPSAVETAAPVSAPSPSVTTAAAQTPEPSVASAVASGAPAAEGDKPLAAKPPKKLGAVHLAKSKHAGAKVSVARH